MKKVVILGCGPAGLMAAAAVEDAGYEPVIASKKRKSEMYGAQYLHQPIPGHSPETAFDVTYTLNGTFDDYRRKVYGPDLRIPVSPEDLQENHEGWDIRSTYDSLWQRYADSITHTPFESHAEVSAFLLRLAEEEAVAHFISTIPAPLLCSHPGHSFQAQKIWAVGDAPERGIFSPITSDLNTVTCSGLQDDSWYRKSNIQGYNSVEWSARRARPPLDGVTDVLKPLGTNCDCLPSVHRLGRYGMWSKGVLSHEAYYATIAGLEGSREEVRATEG
jgi:hypothetical protein